MVDTGVDASATVVALAATVVAVEITFDAPGPPETTPAPSSTESEVGSGNVVSLVGTLVSGF